MKEQREIFSNECKTSISNNSHQLKMHNDEISINLEIVQRLLNEQFPHLADRPINQVQPTGTVNAIFRLGDDLCVRLPRRAGWADNIDREWTFLKNFMYQFSLTIPKPFARGKPMNTYPFPWAIYQWIEGMAYHNDLILDKRQAARDLAGFILELRNIGAHEGPHGGRAPLSDLDSQTRTAIASLGSFVNAGALLDLWEISLNALPWNREPARIHGDLIKPNLLVNGGRITAVIDFGGVGVGDPASDIVPAWSVFSKKARKVFREILSVDDDTWHRARGYALHQAVMIIPYYSKTNPDFTAMAKDTLIELLSEID